VPDRYLGRSIGKYRVTRLLGTGAFSWVYEAVDQDLEIPVALKVLRPEFAGQDAAETRFRREAAMAARLRHPNIVTVRDVGQVEGAVFVAMDLHPLTLGRRLALMGRLPETECVRLGLGVAAALAVAHASGVVHRDIKPDNILLDDNGDAVVADFGLARALAGASSVSATNQVLGTPQYFSPEQARGLELDGRSDLYALGVTLFRCATGHVPFDGADWYAIARQHIEEPPPSLRVQAPEITPEFDAVVQRLLAKDPSARFANAVQLVDAMAALPTAPERSTSLPRVGASTIDAFRPAHAPSRARLLVPAVALGALAIWIGVSAPWRDQGVTPPVPSAGADTMAVATPGTRPDSLGLGGDTSMPLTVPTPARPDTSRGGRTPATSAPTPPRERTAHLELIAPDSALLYVDNRQVGVGRWSGEHAPASRIAVRAVFGDAAENCRTASRDTTLRARAGDRVVVQLEVRDCVGVRFEVRPREARVSMQPLDGGMAVETRADSASALLMPTGRYEVRVSAPRCFSYVDSLLVRRQPQGAPLFVRAVLECS
jgi:serine/threonine-protein kinase